MSKKCQNFEEACEKVNKLPTQSNDTLLKLYSLFKQATEGDVQGKKPGLLDVRGRAKYSAWESLKGMNQHQAREDYLNLVNQLFENL